LDGFKGDTIELSTSTKLKMNKGGRGGVELNPYYDRDVRKEKTSKYLFGKNYLDMINESLAAEGKPAATEGEFGNKLPWGEYEVKDKVVAYNGARYIRCYPIKDQEGDEVITIDGVPATKEELEVINKYVPENKPSKKQENAGITESNRVMPMLFSFDNINFAVIDGTRYEVEK
ncbi:MAG: hypothetical protein II697_02780, partial [Clostridia bacterium]|nr:hypothetical protein [Clostridia bacterium]